MLARIEFLQPAVTCARLHRDWRLAQAAVRAGQEGARERLQTAEAAKDQFFRDLGITWSMNIVRPT